MVEIRSINISELDDYLKLAELQRHITIGLERIEDLAKLQKKWLDDIKGRATTLSTIKSKLHLKKKDFIFSEEEIKKINKLLEDRHIKF